MSGFWALMDASGVFPEQLRSYGGDGWVALPPGIGWSDSQTLMRSGDGWVARPALPDPETLADAAGVVRVRFAAVPDGAASVIHDRAGGDLLARVDSIAGEIAFGLVDPGTFQIDVTAPLPLIGRTISLEAR